MRHHTLCVCCLAVVCFSPLSADCPTRYCLNCQPVAADDPYVAELGARFRATIGPVLPWRRTTEAAPLVLGPLPYNTHTLFVRARRPGQPLEGPPAAAARHTWRNTHDTSVRVAVQNCRDHGASVDAVVQAGSGTVATLSWGFDTRPPVSTVTPLVPLVTNAHTLSALIHCDEFADSVSTCAYALTFDGGETMNADVMLAYSPATARSLGFVHRFPNGTYWWQSPLVEHEGPHTLRVAPVDAHGNAGTDVVVHWTVDRTAPRTVLLNTVTLAPTGATASSGLELRLRPGCDEAACMYEVSLDGGSWDAAVPVPSVPGWVWLAQADGAGTLADGNYVLRLRAVDAAGNVSPLSILKRVLVDTTVPPVQLKWHTGTSDVQPVASAMPSFQLAYSVHEPGCTISLAIRRSSDEAAPNPPALAWMALPRNVTATQSLGSTMVVAPGEGEWVVHVRATDAAGNVGGGGAKGGGAEGATITVLVLTTPPTTAWDPAPPAPSVTSSHLELSLRSAPAVVPLGAMALHGAVAARARIEFQVQVQASGQAAGPWLPVPSSASAEGSTVSTVLVSKDIEAGTGYTRAMVAVSGLPQGDVTLRVRGVDAAGNMGAPVSTLLMVDSSGPLLAWSAGSGAPQAVVGPVNASMALMFSASDAQSVTFTVTVDGSPVPVQPAATVSAGTVATAVTPSLAPGAHVAVISAVDAAGTAARAPLVARWVYDGTAPALELLHDGLPAVTNNQSLTLGVRCADASAPDGAGTERGACVAIEYKVESVATGADVCAVHDGEEGAATDAPRWHPAAMPRRAAGSLVVEATVSVAGLTSGQYRAYLRARDAAGNEANLGPLAFTVDTTPPAQPVLHTVPPSLSTKHTVAVVVATPAPEETLDRFEYVVVQPEVDADAAIALATSDATWVHVVVAASHTTLETTVPQDGIYVMLIRCVDAAGNVGPSAVTRWQVVAAMPVLSPLAAPRPTSVSGWERASGGFALSASSAMLPQRAAMITLVLRPRNETRTCYNTTTCVGTWGGLSPGMHWVDASAVLLDTTNAVVRASQAIAWTVHTCQDSDSEYAIIHRVTGSVRCVPCPTGAYCAGNATATTLRALPGWWTPAAATSTADGDVAAAPVRCPNPTACIEAAAGSGGKSGGSACGDGHTGFMCGECATDYTRLNGGCTRRLWACKFCTRQATSAHTSSCCCCCCCIAPAPPQCLSSVCRWRRFQSIGCARLDCCCAVHSDWSSHSRPLEGCVLCGQRLGVVCTRCVALLCVCH